jgi:ergothioneine biosynthesis protein EgtB
MHAMLDAAVAGSEADSGADAIDPARRYAAVRAASRALAEPLEPEDFCLQSMPDASPVKWHLAHTTWFFEAFVLARQLPGQVPFHPRFGYLFNSYYESVGRMHPRPRRGLLTRPTMAEVWRYRDHVDTAMAALLARGVSSEAAAVIEVGLQHEQQHQELVLTDLKHGFSCNPLRPAYRGSPTAAPAASDPGPVQWLAHEGGLVEVGHSGQGFGFDNEFPRHRAYLQPFAIASRLATCGEWLEFMADGGYRRAELWLSAGWEVMQREGWQAPLYWFSEQERDGDAEPWQLFTLAGMRPVDPAEPVCHVSYYEADAFARWRGCRLPTEAEWEHACGSRPVAGNFAESGSLHPRALAKATDHGPGPHQAFGDAWEWTASAYAPYPGYRAWSGSLGEYNGKFMCNQLVLRGGSCATPASHARGSYRNFFPPEARWQFSGLRLARDP